MSLFLTDAEIDDMCQGQQTNAAKVRHLRAMMLVVNTKPNGRPLVVRSHAEAILSGLKQIQTEQLQRERPQPNRASLILAFGPKKATV